MAASGRASWHKLAGANFGPEVENEKGEQTGGEYNLIINWSLEIFVPLELGALELASSLLEPLVSRARHDARTRAQLEPNNDNNDARDS